MDTNNKMHTPGPWEYDEHEVLKQKNEPYSFMYQVIAQLGDIYHEESGDSYIEETDANGRLIAAAPELLRELELAHQIIRNALNIMTPAQKNKWAQQNEIDQCDGEGTTRANERLQLFKAI